jgi:hypothetical protein
MADALGVEGVMTLASGGVIGDARMYQMRSTRARRRTTRFGATAHSYRLSIQDGDVMLRMFVDAAGAAVPLPTAGDEVAFTMKQASGHTAHSMNLLIYDVVKMGRSDDDSDAMAIILAQITGTHT